MTTNNDRQNNRVLVLTGTTIEEVDELIEASKQTGKKPSLERCYVCGRQEGHHSAAIDPLAGNIAAAKIKMHRVYRKIGNMIMAYDLCLECRVLLQVRAEEQTDMPANISMN